MILTEFLVVLYADHVRFHPCHPYIRLSNKNEWRQVNKKSCEEAYNFQVVGPDYCNGECLILHLGNNKL